MSLAPEFEATGPGREKLDPAANPQCCPAQPHDLTAQELDADVTTFSALANDTRYEILRLLAAADREVCACELDPQLPVNQSTASRALGTLHRAGLVDRRKEGRWRYYTTTPRADRLLQTVDTIREGDK